MLTKPLMLLWMEAGAYQQNNGKSSYTVSGLFARISSLKIGDVALSRAVNSERQTKVLSNLLSASLKMVVLGHMIMFDQVLFVSQRFKLSRAGLKAE